MAKPHPLGRGFYMGVLLARQTSWLAFGLALCVLIIWGYRMVDARPAKSAVNPVQTPCQSWLAWPLWGRGVTVPNKRTVGLAGAAGEVMGVSLRCHYGD